MELIVILGALSLCPWAIKLISRSAIIPVGVAVLCAGVVVGPMFFSFKLGMQMSIDRLLLLTMLATWFVRHWTIVLGSPKIVRVDVLMGCLAAWLLVSAIPTVAPSGVETPISRWLTFIAIPLVMYVIARLTPLTLRDCGWLLKAMVGLGCYLAVIGILEVTGLHGLVFPRYIVDPTNWEFLGRARGPLLNPTGNGTVLAIGFAAALAGFMQAIDKQSKVNYAIASALIGIGLVATLTRSVWIGGMLVGLIVALTYDRRLLPSVGFFGLGAIVLFVTVGSLDGLIALKRDQHLSSADSEKSLRLRPILAIVAVEMFKDSPLRGHGYGGYFTSSLPYFQDRSHEAALDSVRPYMQHNILLSLLVDSGLIAVCLFMAWLGMTARTAWKLGNDAARPPEIRALGTVMNCAFAAYMFNGMFHDVSVIPMLNNFVFFLAGVTTTAALRPRENLQAAQRGIRQNPTVAVMAH